MRNTALKLILPCFIVALIGCKSPSTDKPPHAHPTTAAIDVVDRLIRRATGPGRLDAKVRTEMTAQRWQAVQRAVAYHGPAHRDAFYTSRASWHAGPTRGISWALDQRGDLEQAYYVDGRANIRIAGDMNADVEATGNSVVHILGDLNAKLELKGICEVVIAGRMTDDATIVCDGQLELFVGGDTAGVFGATGSATIIIDGNAGGYIQCGSPATTLTITGDLTGQIAPPKDKAATLSLRIEGYATDQAMQSLAKAGFTRATASVGTSDVPPGLYPKANDTDRPNTRWVVLQQNDQ